MVELVDTQAEAIAQAQQFMDELFKTRGGVTVPEVRPLPSAGPRPDPTVPIPRGETVVENVIPSAENIPPPEPTIFERITGGASAGFDQGFGPATQPGEGKPLSDVGDVGEAILRTASGTFQAVVFGFTGAMEGLGFSPTDARKLGRDAVALVESTIPLTLAAPATAVRSIAAAEREARRGLRGALGKRKTAGLRAMLEGRKEQLIEDARINALAAAAERRAKGIARRQGKSGTEIEAAGIDANLRVQKLSEDLFQVKRKEILAQPDQILDKATQVMQPTLTLDIQKKAVDLGRQILIERGIPANSFTPQRVQQLVMDLLLTDPQATLAFRLELEAAGYADFEAFGAAFLRTGREASATLNLRRAFFGEMRNEIVFGKTAASRKAAMTFLDNMEKAVTAEQALATPREVSETLMQQLARIFKMSLVSPPPVAMRNFAEANIRITINSLQRGATTLMQRVFSPGTPRLPADPLGDLSRIFNTNARELNSAQVKRLADANPGLKADLFQRLERDFKTTVIKSKLERGEQLSLLDKYEGLLNKYGLYLNRAQEEIVRTAVYGATLDRNLRRVESSVDEMFRVGRFPAGFERADREARLQALDITFALQAGGNRQLGKFFSGYVAFISESRVLPFFEPFPNFLFNATKFVLEQVPTAGLRFMRPINRAKVATGDFSPIAREMVGTAMITLAFAMRKGLVPGYKPGARYDEFLLKGDNRVSFSPFVSMAPFLFLAETALAISEGRAQASVLTPKELRRGLLGSATQIQGMTSGMERVFQSLFKLQARAQPGRQALEEAGNIGAGFLRPALPLRTIIPEIVRALEPIMPAFAELAEAFAVRREIKGQGFLAPLKNVFTPGLLPERESPTRAATPQDARLEVGDTGISFGAPLVSMFTGAVVREPRTPFEKALTRHGFTGAQLTPGTGDARLNALVARFMGPVGDLLGTALVEGPVWREAGPKLRMAMLNNVLKIARKVGLDTADFLSPGGGLERRLRRKSTIDFNAEVEMLTRNLGPDGASPQEILDGIREQVDVELKRQGL